MISFETEGNPLGQMLTSYRSALVLTAMRITRGRSSILAVRMNAIRKGQIENIMKSDVLVQRNFIHSLFGITV
jgi:hypothetical protein